VIAASNRAGMVYRLPASRATVHDLAARLDGFPAADVVLFREDGHAVARRDGAELRFCPADGDWEVEGERDVLDAERHPHGLERSWRALACPNAGEVIVSAAEGWEFSDLGGAHHVGGGSHGSLLAGDSAVPLVAAGFERDPFPVDPLVTDLAPLVLGHFGVEAPSSMRVPQRV
jgi:hypothetical protein